MLGFKQDRVEHHTKFKLCVGRWLAQGSIQPVLQQVSNAAQHSFVKLPGSLVLHCQHESGFIDVAVVRTGGPAALPELVARKLDGNTKTGAGAQGSSKVLRPETLEDNRVELVVTSVCLLNCTT